VPISAGPIVARQVLTLVQQSRRSRPGRPDGLPMPAASPPADRPRPQRCL